MRIKKYENASSPIERQPYKRNYQWRTMPQTDIVYNDYNTGLPVQTGDKVWTDENGNIVTVGNNPNAAADYAVQYGNPTFELGMPEITIEGLGNGKSRGHLTGESFEDRYARELAAPIAKNADVDKTFKEQAQWQYEQSKEKHEADVKAADARANQLTPGAGTFVVAPLAITAAGIGGATLAPWLTSALATPTGQALMYGTLGGELLNGASQLGGYDNFGHLIYNAGGGENWRSLPEWQKTLWNFTNPGYLISGPTSKAIDLTAEGLQQAATNTVKSSIVSDATKTAVNDYVRNMLGIDPSLLTYTIKSEIAPYILPYYMNRALNTNMPKPKGYKEYKIPGIVIDQINENLAGTTYRTQKDIDKVNQILKNIKYRQWDSKRGYADNVDKYSYGVFDNSPLFGRYGRIQISGGLQGRNHRRVLRHEVDHLVDQTITGTSKEYRKMLKEAFPEVQEIERNQLKGDIRDVILQEHNLNNASDEARRDFILSRKLLSDEELIEYITTVGYGDEIPRSALTPHRLTQIRRLLAGYNVYPSVKLPPKSNIINGVKTEMREIPTFTRNSFIKRQNTIKNGSSEPEYTYNPKTGEFDISFPRGLRRKWATEARDDVVQYFDSDDYYNHLIQSGATPEQAWAIAAVRAVNAEHAHPIVFRNLGNYTYGDAQNIGGQALIRLNQKLNNRAQLIDPESIKHTVYHELGGHGSSLNIGASNVTIPERQSSILTEMYKHNEALRPQLRPFYQAVKDGNFELAKQIAPEDVFKTSDGEIGFKEIQDFLKYMEDNQEYSARGIASNIAKSQGLKDGWNIKQLRKYFTDESVDNLLKNVWTIIPAGYGISKFNQSNRKGGKLIPRKYNNYARTNI